MASSVTTETLLQGSWYSLEQAGRLLVTSVTVFDAGDFSTATGIAMFGREELGRYKILRRLADEVEKGRSMSAHDVLATCDDHENKQRAATSSSTMRTKQGTGLGDLLRTRLRESPTPDDWRAADEKLQSATDALNKRTPAVRHRLRVRSFYVDIDANGARWLRPLDIAPKEALDAITDAVNAYSVQRDQLISLPGDPPMMKALDTMRPAPDLPLPRRPNGVALL